MTIGIQGTTVSGSNIDLTSNGITKEEILENSKTQYASKEKQSNEEKAASIEISKEAKENYLALQMGIRDMENAKKQGEAMQESITEMGKAMVIFRRISKGDKVPLKDEKKLMEYSAELYQMAKTAAMLAQNDKPKKYKSVDEDNDHADALQNLQNEGKDTTESDVVEMGEKQ